MTRILRKLTAAVAIMAVLATATTAWAGPIERVRAGQTDVWKARVYAGVPVQVVVDGDGDTDLDLYIYDANGRLLASDDDFTDYCVGSFTPWFTGEVTIRIVNRGSVYNEYQIDVTGGTLR